MYEFFSVNCFCHIYKMSNDQKKTIQINPNIFKVGGGANNKTRKNTSLKNKPVPLISPNVLRNKFLKRIKEHKKGEIEQSKEKEPTTAVSDDIGQYSDEFHDSISYLTQLSQQPKKTNNAHNHTIKHANYNNVHVELELPIELQEQQFEHVARITEPTPITLKNYSVDSTVPYGCLKNGSKPTYRTWQGTKKNVQSFVPTQVQGVAVPMYQPALQSGPIQVVSMPTHPAMLPTQVETPMFIQTVQEPVLNMREQKLNEMKQRVKQQELEHIASNRLEETVTPSPVNLASLIPKKSVIKKTIRKKYTLGKSNIYRKVSVLIKDKNTRKKVQMAHKELKQLPIADVKKYLRDHGFIKVGSNAPNDVLRKTYESAMLTGDVINTNQDIMVHNFMNP